MEVKIYVLKDPITNEIRYIGRTKNSLKVRLRGHLSKSKHRRNHKECWIYSLLIKNLKPNIELLTTIIGWEESYKYEQQLIRKYLDENYNLVNLQDRGDGGKQRNFSSEQKDKISKGVKKAHENGLLHCGRIPVKVFDLDGNFISNFISYKECAEFIGVSRKHVESSMQRKACKLRSYQIRKLNEENPGKYINPRIINNARLKSDKLLETLEEDNQQLIQNLNDSGEFRD